MSKIQYPPGPPLLKALALYLQSGGDNLRFMQRVTQEYGDIVYLQVGWKRNYLLNHPDFIEKVSMAGYQVRRSTPPPMKRALGKGLICSYGVPPGERHRTMRQLMTPYFQKLSVHDTAAMILECAEQAMKNWQGGETRDMEKEMIHLTLAIILKMLVGTDFGESLDAIGKSADIVHENITATPPAVFNTLLERMPLLGPKTKLGRARAHLDSKIYELMEDRRNKNKLDGPDLLSMLLRLQAAGEGGEYLKDKQIRDEIITMLMAGHETISSALAWTWYLLSQHPEVEKKFHEEIETVFKGRTPTGEDLPALQYTRMVFSETMRLYPPVWLAARRPVEDLEIGGFNIPKGSGIYFVHYLIHRDPRFHQDPECFNPERFLPEEKAKRPKFYYFPFGAGNRSCIGEGFAWTEGLLLMAAIAQKWRFHLMPGQRIGLKPLIALQPKFGMRIILEKRKPAEHFKKEPLAAHGTRI